MSIQLLIIIAIIIIAFIIFLFIYRQKKTSNKPDLEKGKNNQVYIGNLAYGVSDGDLRKFFEPYGEIVDTRIVKNNKTGRSKGFAFVTFKKLDQSNQALAAHGKVLQGRRLVVRIAKKRD